MFRTKPMQLTYAASILLTGVSLLSLTVSLPDFAVAAEETRQKEISADQYIEARCTACHSRMLALVFLNRKVETEGLASLDEFLEHHHMPDTEARNAIIQFLERAAEKRPR